MVQKIIETGIWAIGAVIIVTLIYRILPYKKWKNKQPKFVFFPKYSAQYLSPEEEVIANIKQLGFELKPGSSNIYKRGKAYGDFSAKVMKLHIEIVKEKKSVNVYAPLFGVVFDTGDLWRITENIVNGQKGPG